MNSKLLDELGLQILRKLTEENDLSSIARSLGVSRETVRRRIKHAEGPLGRMCLRIDLYSLGLSQVVVLNERRAKRNELPLSIYIKSAAYTYTVNNVRYLVTATPPLNALNEYLTYLKALVGKKAEVYLTYPPLYWIPDLTYIRDPNNPFLYNWEELPRDVREAPTKPKIFLGSLPGKLAKLDRIDSYILNELEKNPLKSIRSIARKRGISQQLAHYHYKNHVMPIILSRNLRIFLNKEESFKGLFLIEFCSDDYLNKFINVFISLPHCLAILPEITKPRLLLNYQVYIYQYADFIRAFSELKELGIIEYIKDLGFFTKSIFIKRALPWNALLPSGWVVENFVKKLLNKVRLSYNSIEKIEVKLWEHR